MNKISIRKIRKNDIDNITLLHNEFEKYLFTIDINRQSEPIEEFRTRFNRDAFSHKKHFKGFIALEGDIAVGYILFHNGYDPDEMVGPIVYIIDLFVMQEKRNMGIGKLLIDQVKQYCKSNGITLIYLYCWKKNIDAMTFYDKNNFEQIKDLAFYKVKISEIQET